MRYLEDINERADRESEMMEAREQLLVLMANEDICTPRWQRINNAYNRQCLVLHRFRELNYTGM